MIDGWMPSVGSSSTSNRGRVMSARAMANCCCCPPERKPALRLQHRLEARKQLERLVDRGGVTVLRRFEHHGEVLPHGELREHAMTLRHVADTGAYALVRLGARDVVPVEVDRVRESA